MMKWINNFGVRAKFLSVPVISILCLAGITFLFYALQQQQQKYLGVMSGNLDRATSLTTLFSKLSGQHIQISNLLISSVNEQDQERVYTQGVKEIDHLRALVEKFDSQKNSFLQKQEERLYQELLVDISEYAKAVTVSIELASVDVGNANESLGRANTYFAQAFAKQDELSKLLNAKSLNINNQLEELTNNRFQLLLAISTALAVVILMISLLMTKMVKSTIDATVKSLQMLAEGNLGYHMEVRTTEEFGQMLSYLNNVSEKVGDVVQRVKNSSIQVRLSSESSNKNNEELSTRTEEQAVTLEQTAASIEEITEAIKKNAELSLDANQMARRTTEEAFIGGKVAQQAAEAMNEISDSSKRISDIISTIDSIAFQTNLLALNAAVEAAKAGEQGRAFAVVASEVRMLANRSADSAKEIKVLIEDSVGKIDIGKKLVDESGQRLNDTAASIEKVSRIVDDIASASREQAAGIDQINVAVSQMDGMTQQNAVLAQEGANNSRSMLNQAVLLNELVSFFTVDDDINGGRLTSQNKLLLS